ncbi:MAG: molybdate ABC transporter substrate-binding protein [Lonepinella koalarum]|nr:molybdate ABC transporter substrate-binding protein [Lonepinella koalarum]
MITRFKKMAAMGIFLLLAESAVAKVTVFAAASMTNALQHIAEEYKKAKPTEEIQFSFASSSTLAKQIEQGAPADIFISADWRWMDYLAQKNAVIESSLAILAGNTLVMIAPRSDQIDKVDLSNTQWQSLLNNTYLALGDPNHVPAGIYAKTAFTYLGQWSQIEHKIAAANNVRGALALVETGESPLGVVYSTDAKASEKVKIVAVFPEQSYQSVEYPMALIKEQKNTETQGFFDYLKSETAKKILRSYGFLVK